MENLHEYMKQFPHNTDCGDRFSTLLQCAMALDKKGFSSEELVDWCLFNYGGTVAGALIDFIHNQL